MREIEPWTLHPPYIILQKNREDPLIPHIPYITWYIDSPKDNLRSSRDDKQNETKNNPEKKVDGLFLSRNNLIDFVNVISEL